MPRVKLKQRRTSISQSLQLYRGAAAAAPATHRVTGLCCPAVELGVADATQEYAHAQQLLCRGVRVGAVQQGVPLLLAELACMCRSSIQDALHLRRRDDGAGC